MRTWSQYLEDTLMTGGLAAAATTAAIALCGRAENRNALAPINAVSHIAWGNGAARQNRASWKYTGTGLGLNALAVASWAGLYEGLFGRRTPGHRLAGAALVSALAYVVDYFIVPKRLTPGFEMRLSAKSLFAIYTTLAASMGLGGLLHRGSLR